MDDGGGRVLEARREKRTVIASARPRTTRVQPAECRPYKELSFIDDGLWGFEITDADGYLLAFFRLRDEQG